MLFRSLGVVLAAPQRTFGPARFEFGAPRTVEGRLRFSPVPSLDLGTPGGSPRSWLLVGQGKHGAPASLAALDGHRVRVTGTLGWRGARSVFELADAPPEDLGAAGDAPAFVPGEPTTLDGEIVDSKCYLGVMNPGNLETHRGCAIRCISGGIPPMLVVRDEIGRAHV